MAVVTSQAGPPVLPWSLPVLTERARRLAEPGRRRLLGLAGPPGAGKSTLAAGLCDALSPEAARVPLDGFHLANNVLAGLGLADRKGSPETFDAGGFHALLARLRANREQVVYAPEFYRDLDEPVAAVLAIPRTVPLVIVEGNYLLYDEGPWHGTAAFFDQVWYLRPDEATCRRRLVRRHQSHGRTAAEAEAWAASTDEPNARLVAATQCRATAIITPQANTDEPGTLPRPEVSHSVTDAQM